MTNLARVLKELIERRGITQVLLSETTKISQGQISRYLSGDNDPDKDSFLKLYQAFPNENDRAELLLARLNDEIPDSARRFVAVELAGKTKHKLRKPTIPLPRDLEEAFAYFEETASTNPAIAESILATYKILCPEGASNIQCTENLKRHIKSKAPKRAPKSKQANRR